MVKLNFTIKFIPKFDNFAKLKKLMMRVISKIKNLAIVFVLLIIQCISIYSKDFTLVIDAGHGGHDPGAVGATSKEKDINLKVALAFGNLVKQKCPDVKVIYTRNKDVFVPLNRRAEIANNSKADLFISIHTNSVAGSKSATGASTWTLGLAKTEANLEVAKRENSVILYEDDYKQRYAGFNPYSSESYIIFELIQDQYMEQSVNLASKLQKQFKGYCGRADRGVHQAGFLVLKASAMPSVLIELGFISTPSEERYLNSDKGIKEMSNGIYKAFIDYKENWSVINSKDNNQNIEDNEKTESAAEEFVFDNEKEDKEEPVFIKNNDSKTIFKVQFLTSSKKLNSNSSQFKGIKDVSSYYENGIYKYTCYSSEDFNYVNRKKREVSKLFKDAFVVAFKNGKRININKAIEEFKNQKL